MSFNLDINSLAPIHYHTGVFYTTKNILLGAIITVSITALAVGILNLLQIGNFKNLSFITSCIMTSVGCGGFATIYLWLAYMIQAVYKHLKKPQKLAQDLTQANTLPPMFSFYLQKNKNNGVRGFINLSKFLKVPNKRPVLYILDSSLQGLHLFASIKALQRFVSSLIFSNIPEIVPTDEGFEACPQRISYQATRPSEGTQEEKIAKLRSWIYADLEPEQNYEDPTTEQILPRPTSSNPKRNPNLWVDPSTGQVYKPYATKSLFFDDEG